MVSLQSRMVRAVNQTVWHLTSNNLHRIQFLSVRWKIDFSLKQSIIIIWHMSKKYAMEITMKCWTNGKENNGKGKQPHVWPIWLSHKWVIDVDTGKDIGKRLKHRKRSEKVELKILWILTILWMLISDGLNVLCAYKLYSCLGFHGSQPWCERRKKEDQFVWSVNSYALCHCHKIINWEILSVPFWWEWRW